MDTEYPIHIGRDTIEVAGQPLPGIVADEPVEILDDGSGCKMVRVTFITWGAVTIDPSLRVTTTVDGRRVDPPSPQVST